MWSPSRTLFVAVLPIALCGTASAQQNAAPSSPAHVAIGGLAGAGIPGPVLAIRFGLVGSRFGFDFDWGVVNDAGRSAAGLDDRFIAAQMRVLIGKRKENGAGLSFLAGMNHLDTATRTNIRWPDGTRTVQVTPVSGSAGQVGIGFEWLGNHSRVGLDLVTGAAGEAGPRLFAKLFVVWGSVVQIAR
jgi:hypothetical protein